MSPYRTVIKHSLSCKNKTVVVIKEITVYLLICKKNRNCVLLEDDTTSNLTAINRV